MNKMSTFEYEMELDKKYYEKLINADFFEWEGMIFVKDVVKNFQKTFNEYKKRGKTKTEIEKFMNHIVMEFISTFHQKQKKLAQKIIQSWHKKLKEKFPTKKIILQLIDEQGGYTIYLYSKRSEEIENQKIKNRVIIRKLE